MKELRKKLGLTQVQLAEQIGTSQNILTYYETGQKRPPVEKLLTIAKVLNVSVEVLCCKEPLDEAIPAVRTAANSRERQMQEVFSQLKPAEQRALLKQAKALLQK